MKRAILLANDIIGFYFVKKHFEEGWVLDPTIYGGKPLRLENAAVYHLVLYESEDEKPQPKKEKKIISIKSLAIEDADDWLTRGYEVLDRYSKTVTVGKYGEKDV